MEKIFTINDLYADLENIETVDTGLSNNFTSEALEKESETSGNEIMKIEKENSELPVVFTEKYEPADDNENIETREIYVSPDNLMKSMNKFQKKNLKLEKKIIRNSKKIKKLKNADNDETEEEKAGENFVLFGALIAFIVFLISKFGNFYKDKKTLKSDNNVPEFKPFSE